MTLQKLAEIQFIQNTLNTFLIVVGVWLILKAAEK